MTKTVEFHSIQIGIDQLKERKYEFLEEEDGEEKEEYLAAAEYVVAGETSTAATIEIRGRS